jgi:hypothetical protein
MEHTRKLLAAVAATTAAAVIGSGLVADVAAGQGGAAQARQKTSATNFALKGTGFSTKISGGSVPANSGPTAWQVIACTNLAGLNRTNNITDITLPSLGHIDGAKTRVWTTRSHGVVSSWSRNTIGKVTLSDSPLGSLVLTAVSSTARAYHQGGAYKAFTSTDVAKLQFVPPTGDPVSFPIPSPGQPVTIPGFATVAIDQSLKLRSPHGARAFANGLKVTLLASDTVVRVAHAAATIGGEVPSGLFVGSSYALDGKAGGDIVGLGKNPLLTMPCQGTDGKVVTRSLVGTNLGGQVVVGAAKSQQMSDQTKRRAHGWERSSVASINLGDGALKITGIVGQANVSRGGKHLRTITRSTRGTTIGAITVNGEAQELPLDQVLEIPGVAKLEPQVVTKLPGGIKVTALRITVLDGSGAVINLGNAQLKIRRPSS